jgi:hypothetical protein
VWTPGLSTFDWIDHHTFDHIIGIDPSAGMITAANNILRENDAMKRREC